MLLTTCVTPSKSEYTYPVFMSIPFKYTPKKLLLSGMILNSNLTLLMHHKNFKFINESHSVFLFF